MSFCYRLKKYSISSRYFRGGRGYAGRKKCSVFGYKIDFFR
nr:MAG TPA: hypothetical protein [Caudoviricetes sp.]